MAAWAALITAIATLIGVLVWPVTLIVVAIIFRDQIRAASGNLPAIMGRMQEFNFGPLGFKMRALQAELSTNAAGLVDEALETPGAISPRQIESAARMKVAARGVSDRVLGNQLQQLCIEYETIRKVMPSGKERTRAMIDVLVRLRTLAPSVSGFLDELKASSSPGKRLAAVAIMQVDPAKADVSWIVDRLRSDDPFIFFQACTILRNLANRAAGMDETIPAAARQGLAILRGFDGEPDRNTIDLLESIAAGEAA